MRCRLCGNLFNLTSHHSIPSELFIVKEDWKEQKLIDLCVDCHRLIHQLFKNEQLKEWAKKGWTFANWNDWKMSVLDECSRETIDKWIFWQACTRD